MSGRYENLLQRAIREIHRRSLWQVLGIYGVASWVVFEVIQTLTEGLGLPGWFPAFAFVLLLIGLPIVLATAFVQEGGPDIAGSDAPLIDASGREIGKRESGSRSGSPTRRLFTWRNAIVGGVLAFALWGVVAAGWIVFRSAEGETDTGSLHAADDTKVTVAVLPFENLSASAENEYFARGMHEAILTNLARVADLTVLSRTSVMGYGGTDKNVRTIARELGAAAVVEGSVQRAGDRIRVTAQLIDARSDAHLWADSYDRTVEDVFAVQSDVARQVSDALEAALTPSEERRIERRPTESLTAYDLYLKGREAYDRFTQEGNDEAIRLYREAIAADSAFALARAGLANAYGLRVMNYGQERRWGDSAVVAARRAVEIDPELDEAHKALALAYFAQGRVRRSVEEGLEAVELNPNHHAAVNNLGVAYTRLGRLAEAVAWARRTVRLAPNNPVGRGNVVWAYANLGDTTTAARWLREAEVLGPDDSYTLYASAGLHLARGEPGRALERLERATELYPETPSIWANAARFALFVREYETAVGAARRSLDLNPGGGILDDKPVRSVLGFGLLMTGREDEGRQMLRSALERAHDDLSRGVDYPQIPWEIGATHAALGDSEEAIHWLRRGYEAGYRMLSVARHDPMLDPVRDDPRFERIMAEMEADVERMRERVVREERLSSSKRPGFGRP